METLSVKLERNSDGVFITLTGSEKLKAACKKLNSGEVRQSNNYQSAEGRLSYYNIDEQASLTGDIIDELRRKSIIITKYGSCLNFEGMLNVSMIRTVGLSQGVKVEVSNIGLLYSKDFLVKWAKAAKDAANIIVSKMESA